MLSPEETNTAALEWEGNSNGTVAGNHRGEEREHAHKSAREQQARDGYGALAVRFAAVPHRQGLECLPKVMKEDAVSRRREGGAFLGFESFRSLTSPPPVKRKPAKPSRIRIGVSGSIRRTSARGDTQLQMHLQRLEESNTCWCIAADVATALLMSWCSNATTVTKSRCCQDSSTRGKWRVRGVKAGP